MGTRHVNRSRSRSFARDRVAWLRTFVVLAVVTCVAWYRAIGDPPVRIPVPEARTTSPVIAIVTYDRITADGRDHTVSRSQFEQHINALIEDGYEPLRVQDVVDFYYSGRPVPERSVLLTFDWGILDTYIQVDPVLRRVRWPAAMSLLTAKQASRDSFYLYWDRLRVMHRSGIWELGSNGHLNTRTGGGVDADGQSFYMSRWQIEEEARADGADADFRAESDDEFVNRVRADLVRSRSAIKDGIESGAPAFWSFRLPQFMDPSRQRLANLALDAAGKLFPIVILDGSFGTNDRLSDPGRLRRLRVGPEMSAAELLGRLGVPSAAAEPVRPVTGSGILVSTDDDRFTLSGAPGAEVTLPGSALLDDWFLAAEVRIDADQFWVTQADADGGRRWRWGTDGMRSIAQELAVEGPPTRLWQSESTLPVRDWAALELLKRGNALFLTGPGFDPMQPVVLPETGRGPVDLEVWTYGGTTNLQLRNFAFEHRVPSVLYVASSPTAGDIGVLKRRVRAVSVLSPRWAVVETDVIQFDVLDVRLLEVLTHRYGVRISPAVRFAEASWSISDETWIERVRDTLDHALRDGWRRVTLDLDGVPDNVRERWIAAVGLDAAADTAIEIRPPLRSVGEAFIARPLRVE